VIIRVDMCSFAYLTQSAFGGVYLVLDVVQGRPEWHDSQLSTYPGLVRLFAVALPPLPPDSCIHCLQAKQSSAGFEAESDVESLHERLVSVAGARDCKQT
jgi:hypothetical protein